MHEKIGAGAIVIVPAQVFARLTLAGHLKIGAGATLIIAPDSAPEFIAELKRIAETMTTIPGDVETIA